MILQRRRKLDRRFYGKAGGVLGAPFGNRDGLRDLLGESPRRRCLLNEATKMKTETQGWFEAIKIAGRQTKRGKVMAVFEGFTAGFECDDCEAPYGSEFSTAEEMLIAVLSETAWNFTVKDGVLVILCRTCNFERQLSAL